MTDCESARWDTGKQYWPDSHATAARASKGKKTTLNPEKSFGKEFLQVNVITQKWMRVFPVLADSVVFLLFSSFWTAATICWQGFVATRAMLQFSASDL